MPMYDLLEYSQNYSMTSRSLYNYYKGEIDDINDNASDGKVTIQLKYLSNFWRLLDLTLINCEIELDLSGKKTVY